MYTLLNKNTDEALKIFIDDSSKDNDERSYFWEEGGIEEFMYTRIIQNQSYRLQAVFKLYEFGSQRHHFILCKNADMPIVRDWPTISRIILEKLENGKYKLHIRSMSQNPEDTIPSFEITAEDFQVYRWVDDGTKDESGRYPKYPSLNEFIKWYEENVKED